ncbi:MAG: hypothetical protein U5N55_01510 [Cypionkella sp.]|nr:hypothetical protein [Cypionkella sp.]
MADWFEIPLTMIDAESPIVAELAGAWTNNVIAAFEGAEDAPRLAADAHPRFTHGSVTLNRFGGSEGIDVSGPTLALSGSDTTAATTRLHEFTAMNDGSLRVLGSIRGVDAAIASIIIKKNGATLDTTSDSSGSYQSVSYNLTFLAGDFIEVLLKTTLTTGSGGGTGYAQYKDMRLASSGVRGVYRL